YALMGTHELANHVVMSSQHANVILLENHGILCLAKSLLSAFERVEVLEAAAKMTIVSRLMGNSKHLNREQLNQIDKMMLDLD
ncbi:MAG: class II aldolase/adducin family protein, partial [Bacteroidales bacterium]|nr:class II aldolase/adducin family protein [Bacteroidales bacterium]